MSSRKVLLLIVLIVVVAAAGLWLYRTRKPEPHRAVVPVGTPVQIAVPLGLPPVGLPWEIASRMPLAMMFPSRPQSQFGLCPTRRAGI